MKYYFKYTIYLIIIIIVTLLILANVKINLYPDPYLMSCGDLNKNIMDNLHNDGGFSKPLKDMLRAAVEKQCVLG